MSNTRMRHKGISLTLSCFVYIAQSFARNIHYVGCFGISDQARRIQQYTDDNRNCVTECAERGLGAIIVGAMWCGCQKFGDFGPADEKCSWSCKLVNTSECRCNDGFPPALDYATRARYLAQQYVMNLKREKKHFRNCFLRNKFDKQVPFDAMPDSECKYIPMTVYRTKEAKELEKKGCYGKLADGVSMGAYTLESTFRKCRNFCIKDHERKYAALASGLLCGCVKKQGQGYNTLDELTPNCLSGALCFDDRQGSCLCSNKSAQPSILYDKPTFNPDRMTCFNRRIPTKIVSLSASKSISLPGKSGTVCRNFCRVVGGSRFSVYYNGRECKCVNTIPTLRHHKSSCSSACGANRGKTQCGSGYSAVVYSIKRQKTASRVNIKAEVKKLKSGSGWTSDDDVSDDIEENKVKKKKKQKTNNGFMDSSTATTVAIAAGFGLFIMLAVVGFILVVKRNSRKDKKEEEKKEEEALIGPKSPEDKMKEMSTALTNPKKKKDKDRKGKRRNRRRKVESDDG